MFIDFLSHSLTLVSSGHFVVGIFTIVFSTHEKNPFSTKKKNTTEQQQKAYFSYHIYLSLCWRIICCMKTWKFSLETKVGGGGFFFFLFSIKKKTTQKNVWWQEDEVWGGRVVKIMMICVCVFLLMFRMFYAERRI